MWDYPWADYYIFGVAGEAQWGDSGVVFLVACLGALIVGWGQAFWGSQVFLGRVGGFVSARIVGVTVRDLDVTIFEKCGTFGSVFYF